MAIGRHRRTRPLRNQLGRLQLLQGPQSLERGLPGVPLAADGVVGQLRVVRGLARRALAEGA